MRAAPYIALVGDDEVFNKFTHTRRDLDALDLEIECNDGELPVIRMRVKNPRTPISALLNKRVFLSSAGKLIADATLSSVPRGAVGRTVDLEAVARPADLDELLALLAEDMKQAPFWDTLFVPQGSEDDWAEILAGRSSILAYSRTGGVSVVDALSGSTNLSILPHTDSISYDRQPVAPSFGIELTAKWKQAVRQVFNLHSGNVFRDFTTANMSDIKSGFPRAGMGIGSGFSVIRGSAAQKMLVFKPVETKHSRFGTTPGNELDPAFDGRLEKQYLTVAEMDLSLSIEHNFETNRTETSEFSFPVSLQDGAAEGEEEIETVALRDISERSSASSWQANKDYNEGDEVVDGSSVYTAREDHYSGSSRDAAKWSLSGETSYLSSRRVSSFFRSTRGQQALAHAVERVRARARVASRCVTVEFECDMPDPSLITEDCTATIAHPLIPGGSVNGRLIGYSLFWSNGRQWMSGTIAACPGTDAGEDLAIEVESGTPKSVEGRIDVSIENAGAEQAAAFLSGETPGPTKITIKATPATSGDFEHEVFVSISGSVEVPQGVNI